MVYLLIIAAICGCDFWVKKYMDESRALNEEQAVAGGKIILKKFYNTGAFGNLLSGSPKAILCIHAAVLGGVCTELLRLLFQKGSRMAKLGLAFVAGAGAGNLYDRLAKGHVVDYFRFGFGPKRFRKTVFNIADLFIFAGTALVFLAMCTTKKKEG